MTSKSHLSYWTIQPNKWTFETPKIRHWVENHLEGTVLNACAGPTKLSHNEELIRNDINPDVDADLHIDIQTIDNHFPENTFDTIVYDPPFSSNQAEQTYNIENGTRYDQETKTALHQVLKPNGKIIQFGYTSNVMPASLNYSLEELSLWNTLGRQHDWLGTVLQHSTDTTRTTNYVYDSVIPNQNATDTVSSATATSGNENTPISIEYHSLNEDDNLQTSIREFIEQQLTNRVLHLCSSNAELDHSDQVVRNAISDNINSDHEFIPEQLSTEYAEGVFDTIVFDPDETAFQHTTEYYGDTTGLDTAFKRAAHSLLDGTGSFIQVGHTATCMPQSLSYNRSTIGIFSHPNTIQDLIVTVDTKQHTDIDAYSRSEVPADIRDHAPNSTTPARHQSCVRCGDNWYMHPVWYVDCPVCGAARENYCVHNGTVSHTPHEERFEVLHEHHFKHGHCVEHGTADTGEEHSSTLKHSVENTAESASTRTQETLATFNSK